MSNAAFMPQRLLNLPYLPAALTACPCLPRSAMAELPPAEDFAEALAHSGQLEALKGRLEQRLHTQTQLAAVRGMPFSSSSPRPAPITFLYTGLYRQCLCIA